MSTNFKGMDADRVEVLTNELESAAQRLNSVVSTVDSAVSALLGVWFGEVVQLFHGHWVGSQRGQAHAAAVDISGVVTTLRRNIDAQRGTSNALAGPGIGGSLPGWIGRLGNPSLLPGWSHTLTQLPAWIGGATLTGGAWNAVIEATPLLGSVAPGLLQRAGALDEWLHEDSASSASPWDNLETLTKAEEGLGHHLGPLDAFFLAADNSRALGEIGSGHANWFDVTHTVIGDIGSIPAVNKTPVGFLSVVAANAWTSVAEEATKVDWSQRGMADTFSYMATHPVDVVESFGDAVTKTATEALSWLPKLW